MTLILGERSIQKGIHDFQSNARSYHSASHAQNVCIVVLSRRFCGETVGAQRCADARNFVCRDGNTDAGTADQNATVTCTGGDGCRYLAGIDRIIYGLCAVCAEVLILQSSCFQMLLYFLHQFISTVITTQSYHTLPSFLFSATRHGTIFFRFFLFFFPRHFPDFRLRCADVLPLLSDGS